jgi:hypothetical protein
MVNTEINPNSSDSTVSWCFYVNDYKNDYDIEATWANDWLDGGIRIVIHGIEKEFPLDLLIVEDLEDFLIWLKEIKYNRPRKNFFQFMDTELAIEELKVQNIQYLRMIYGIVNDSPIMLDTRILADSLILCDYIKHIESILARFPCRCDLPHASFT